MRCISDDQPGDESNPQSPSYIEPAYTFEAAQDDAADELMATPCVVGAALESLSDPLIGDDLPGRSPVKVADLCRPELDTLDMPSYQLLALLMSATDDASVLRAVKTLRERVKAHLADDIDARAEELLEQAA